VFVLPGKMIYDGLKKTAASKYGRQYEPGINTFTCFSFSAIYPVLHHIPENRDEK